MMHASVLSVGNAVGGKRRDVDVKSEKKKNKRQNEHKAKNVSAK